MNKLSFYRDDIIFQEGDAADCMYDIAWGRVGIFLNYGLEDEKKLADLCPGQIFGEMGLLDQAPRSATAVALESGTELRKISEDDFHEFFFEDPGKVLMIMQQMSNRLRRTTKDYMEACQTVYESLEAEKNGSKKNPTLLDRIKKFCEIYKGFNYYAHT